MFDRDLPHDARRDLFGGHGVVRVWALVEAPARPFTAILACELEAGASVGTHLQTEYPEIVVAISGTGGVSVNGHSAAFSAGNVIELAQGQTLSIANESSVAVLRYLIIKAQKP
jgi:hypothetical protein